MHCQYNGSLLHCDSGFCVAESKRSFLDLVSTIHARKQRWKDWVASLTLAMTERAFTCKLLFLSLLIISTCALGSNDVANTQTQNTVSQNTTVQTSHIGTAKDWALTDSEWKQYLSLMQGFAGHYYMTLSPPEVLGIQADNAQELRHFAEIAAKLEHDKLERELRFNLAFHQAAMRLYSTEPMIQPFDYTPFTPIPKN